MSMGYLIPESSPVAWRGLMVMKALQQLLHEVEWGGLDILVLDLPPGTGDVQLTITQQLVLDGAIVVSTPQDLALKDAAKGVELFRKVDTTILGLVCNMSGFQCPGCGETHDVFGDLSKLKEMCRTYGMRLLGELPLHANMGAAAEGGKPTVVAEPESSRAKVFASMAQELARIVDLET